MCMVLPGDHISVGILHALGLIQIPTESRNSAYFIVAVCVLNAFLIAVTAKVHYFGPFMHLKHAPFVRDETKTSLFEKR